MTAAVLIAAGVAAGIDVRRLTAVTAVLVAPWLAVAAVLLLVLRARRQDAIGGTAPLTAVAGELRSGRALRSALESVLGTDPTDPLGLVGRRARLGLPMAQVVEGLDRAFGTHGPLVAASLRLVDRRGGSAADALDVAAQLVRDEADLSRELAAATAPARLSAWVVGLAPMVFLWWQVASGSVARTLATPGGAVMLGLGGLLVAVGVAAVYALGRMR